jgi:hypothetical protein
MLIRKRPSRRVFGLSLTEVVLELTFLLLALLAASTTYYADIEKMREELARQRSFQEQVEGVLATLGVSLDEMRKVASRLVAAEMVEQSKLNLAKLIDQLLADNRRLRGKISDLEKNLLDTIAQALKAEAELSRLGKPDGEGGTEPGSCWVDAEGRVQYFLHITIHDQDLQIRAAWPAARCNDLWAMGVNLDEVPSGVVANAQFSDFARPIHFRTVNQGCRLFARLVDRTTSKDSYKRQRKLIERYFFVREVEQ